MTRTRTGLVLLAASALLLAALVVGGRVARASSDDSPCPVTPDCPCAHGAAAR